MRGIGRAGFYSDRAISIWLVGLTALTMTLGIALAAPSAGATEGGEPATEHCPGGWLEKYEAEKNELNGLVLQQGVVFCVKGSTDATERLTADGITSLYEYLDNGHDVSYYVVYEEPDKDPIDTDLILTSMCQLDTSHIWRVQNDNVYPVDFEVIKGAGPAGAVTANPGWTYFRGAQETTIIAWGGEGTEFVYEETTKAANREKCQYEVTLVKEWAGEKAPEGGPFVDLRWRDGSETGGLINEGEKAKLDPGTLYVVTEDVPEGWEATSGLGQFTVPVWPGPEAFFGTYDPRFGGAEKFITHTVVNREKDAPVEVALRLTSMCQLDKEHVWRVQNDTSYSVPFEVVLGAGSGGIAEPGWTYFMGSAETTKIVWGGEGTDFVAGETVKAANTETCAFDVSLVKEWDDKDAPEGGPFVTLTVDKEDAVGAEVINEGGTVKVLPGGSFVVTEDVPEGWEATSGLGEFTVPVWPGPEAFFGTYDPRFGGAEKFITHTVVNEEKGDPPSQPPTNNPTTQVLANEVEADCFDGTAADETGTCVLPEPPAVTVLGIQVEATTTTSPPVTTVDSVTADTLPFTGDESDGLVAIALLALAAGAVFVAASFYEPALLRGGRHEAGRGLPWKNTS